MVGLVFILALVAIALIVTGLIKAASATHALREGVVTREVPEQTYIGHPAELTPQAPRGSSLADRLTARDAVVMGTPYPGLRADSHLTDRERATRERLKSLYPTVEEAAEALGVNLAPLV